MRFNVLLADLDFKSSKELENYKNKVLNDTSISFCSNYKELIEKIPQSDLIFFSTSLFDYEKIINKCIEEKTYLILLCETQIKLTNKSKYIDCLFKPLHYNNIIYKIEYLKDLIENNIKQKQEKEISNCIVDNLNNPIFTTNELEIIFANDHFLKLISCNSIDEINKKYTQIGDIFIEHENCFLNSNNDWLNECSNKTLNVCIKNSKNEHKFFSIQKVSLTHNNTHIILLNDISHEIIHKQELDKLLYTDTLTNLNNRAKLIKELQNSNSLVLTSICLLDINSFKEINDFYGHKAGDLILKELSLLIKKSISNYKSLKLYKFHSDTYCITNTKNNKEEFLQIIRNIIELAYKTVFKFGQYEIDIRVTAGMSFSNKNNKLITADIALQTAKKNHKDYIIFYDELDKFQEYENNMLWTKKLKSAFVKDNIEVYFQPLISNKTLNVDKYECLVRLIDEDGKVIEPFFFLDISKRSNQYTKLTKIVIEKSFKKFSNLPFEFSVNISYEDIENPEFLVFIKEMLKEYEVAQKVVFEILEDENVKNYTHLINFIDEVKNLGCKVAIDDFGSGYSNFEHLLKMNVDYLKIDASLIKNIATDENSYKITKTIVDFAKSLNLQTIAEYVENEEIFEITKRLGVDYSQGYYFSAPIAEPLLIDFKNWNKNE